MNVSGQSSAGLVGEYLPAVRGDAGKSAADGLTLPSGGAVLQRVTVLATQPDDTIVMLRADYAAPATTVAAGVTYEGLSSRSPRSTPALPPQDSASAERDTAGGNRFGALASAWLAPATLYARTQGGSGTRDAAKGGVIDVLA